MECASRSVPVAAALSPAVAVAHLTCKEIDRVHAFTLADATAATCSRLRNAEDEAERWREEEWGTISLRLHPLSNPVTPWDWDTKPTFIPIAIVPSKTLQIFLPQKRTLSGAPHKFPDPRPKMLHDPETELPTLRLNLWNAETALWGGGVWEAAACRVEVERDKTRQGQRFPWPWIVAHLPHQEVLLNAASTHTNTTAYIVRFQLVWCVILPAFYRIQEFWQVAMLPTRGIAAGKRFARNPYIHNLVPWGTVFGVQSPPLSASTDTGKEEEETDGGHGWMKNGCLVDEWLVVEFGWIKHEWMVYGRGKCITCICVGVAMFCVVRRGRSFCSLLLQLPNLGSVYDF